MKVARIDARDRLAQLGLELRELRPLEDRRDDCVGALEEVVDDLDLVGTCAEARERIDEPLQAVVVLDDLVRGPLLQRVRLVVDDERAAAVELQDVQAAAQENAVVLERERTLRARAGEGRDAARQVGLAVRAHEAGDPLELLVADARIPTLHERDEIVGRQRLLEVDELEQPVDGVADLGCRKPGRPGRRVALVRRTHADDTLGVVAIRAALEQREGAEGEPAHSVERRSRNVGERRQPRHERRQRGDRVLGEQGKLPVVREGLPRDRLLLRVAVDPQDHACALALELDGLLRRTLDLLARLEAPDHPADRGRLVRRPRRVDRARDDQPVDRPRHGDVVEAEPLGALLGLARLLDLFVGVHAATLAREGIGDAETEAAVRQREDLVGRRRRPVAPGVGDHDHLELQPLRRVDRQQADGIASLFLRDRFELARADGLLVAHEAHEALDVRAAELLVRPGQPGELAQVGVAAAAVPLREDGEVVVVLGENAFAQPLER